LKRLKAAAADGDAKLIAGKSAAVDSCLRRRQAPRPSKDAAKKEVASEVEAAREAGDQSANDVKGTGS